ncbi:MAG: CAAX prenyl protease-related protein [Candidatus Scalindua sp. AMX11]|nr:MAG: CAAX prenyl protease-related protein [Candidatus Scalindua sp.]NOG85724.1 CAAX prenyl protease-related protein [Planctomycetota bacterium]RZV73172.1 MAG: CAAX prenyl protease-related protein [Candidatus Scalindua sp. SCAELEC01]TDE64740.1 MAG: CAAX prenyl protease-related protein [Candidatus Scalindua sp. AMX11]GJQ58698.1 MAG: CAAX prenyl protease-related protein [Candidatus Scalindua sp.]
MVSISTVVKSAWFPRVFPFLLFICFIAIEGLIDLLSQHYDFMQSVAEYDGYILYPVKTVVVAVVLVLFWNRYREVDIKQTLSWRNLSIGVLAGIAVFLLWINLDRGFAVIGKFEGFDPFLAGPPILVYLLISFRLFGAAVVVPIFEELFWRSFVVRYLIDPKFEEVPIGKFTWPSFIISSVIFGFEHNLWLAGIVAGIAYCLVLCYTKSLSTAILSHGVTNLFLGIYVLSTGYWHFW